MRRRLTTVAITAPAITRFHASMGSIFGLTATSFQIGREASYAPRERITLEAPTTQPDNPLRLYVSV